jgi:hypothetical protein
VAHVVVHVAVTVVIAALTVVTSEHRAGPSRHRAYRAANHRPHRAADRSPGGDASEGADRLRRRRAGAERKAGQRNQGNLVHDPLLPISTQRNHIVARFIPQFAASSLDHREKCG